MYLECERGRVTEHEFLKKNIKGSKTVYVQSNIFTTFVKYFS